MALILNIYGEFFQENINKENPSSDFKKIFKTKIQNISIDKITFAKENIYIVYSKEQNYNNNVIATAILGKTNFSPYLLFIYRSEIEEDFKENVENINEFILDKVSAYIDSKLINDTVTTPDESDSHQTLPNYITISKNSEGDSEDETITIPVFKVHSIFYENIEEELIDSVNIATFLNNNLNIEGKLKTYGHQDGDHYSYCTIETENKLFVLEKNELFCYICKNKNFNN